MARNSEKFYNAWGGLDQRSNALKQNPLFARDGYNFRWNYRDELTKMNGFQKKIPAVGSEWGIFEYKYTDINTGESLNEILGVSATGTLNVLRKHFLRLTKAGGLVASYTLFYDASGTPSWKIIFYNSVGASLGFVSFPETDTVLDLAGDINALALAGLTASVVDEDGASVGSTTCLAYTLDTVIAGAISTGNTQNPAWFWSEVVFPDSASVPFPLVISKADDANYEGVTAINLNNALYLTDGGWVVKYDGFQVARAGMPKVLGLYNNLANYNASGFSTIETAAGTTGNWTPGRHAIRFQFCYGDPNGAQVFGLIQQSDPSIFGSGSNVTNPNGGLPHVDIFVPSIKQDHTFPVYACQIDGAQTILAVPTPQTFNIEPGHNLQIGQALRVDIANGITGMSGVEEDEMYYLEITGTTATTVTVQGYPSASTFTLEDGAVFNSCYMPLELMGRSQIRGGLPPIYGAYIKVFATTSVDEFSYYQVQGYLPLPAITSQEYTRNTGIPDVEIQQGIPFDDADLTLVGADLPRAGRYISTWQEILVQGGRTPEPSLASEYYASVYDPALVLSTNNNAIEAERLVTYTESSLCDFQSIYWAETGVPEGFPQDGLHEFLVSSPFNDELRGICPNKDSFFCFKTRTTAYLTGSLADNNVQMEIMESDAGAACHKAIQNVEGAIFFMDQNSGFWSVVAGRLPVFIGYGVQNSFKENRFNYNFRKAWATNFRFQDQYICYIPGSPGIMFVYDYANTPTGSRSAWYPWSAMNAGSGLLATAEDELLVSSKDVPTLWLQKFTGTKYDFSIHTSSVPFSYVGSWLNFGYPTIDKKFVKVWLNSIQGGFDIMVRQFANYLAPEVASEEINFPSEDADKLTVKNWMELSEDKLSAISISFENDAIYEDVRIQGWEIEYAPGFDTNEARE